MAEETAATPGWVEERTALYAAGRGWRPLSKHHEL